MFSSRKRGAAVRTGGVSGHNADRRAAFFKVPSDLLEMAPATIQFDFVRQFMGRFGALFRTPFNNVDNVAALHSVANEVLSPVGDKCPRPRNVTNQSPGRSNWGAPSGKLPFGTLMYPRTQSGLFEISFRTSS